LKRARSHAHVVPDVRESQRYFADKAEAYRQSKTHGNRADLDRMLALVRPRAGERALDVATGGGHTARALADAGCDVLASDATVQMLRGLALPSVVCDAQRLPFRDGAFGVVASRIAPHHFPDLSAFVREAARALAPGGRLYVFDLTTPDDRAIAATIDGIERLRDPSHGHSWSAREWRAACEAAGLRVERLEETASEMELEPWIARAQMPAQKERELRAALARGPYAGYGLTASGAMRVLRVEVLAVK
jgi:ubiquinone/menaquinone biosynthesis C-methylase UbiE